MLSLLKSLPKISVLTLLFPVACWMHWGAHIEGVPLFVVSALTILGTVTLIGKATEEIALYAGPLWGGLLNATFGNVTELIIASMALSNPKLHGVVRASVTGSILGNLLLVLGASMLWGGLKYPTQTFSKTGANVNIGMLWITLIALMLPTFIQLTHGMDPAITPEVSDRLVQSMSLVGAVVLLTIYVLGLLFSLRTHRFLLMPAETTEEKPTWSKATSVGVLLFATLVVAFASDLFVGAMDSMLHGANAVPMSELFVGVIVVAVVGNAAEGAVAVWVARENKMELSYQVAMGSCLQVALMVTPLLVFLSYLMGHPLSLAFSPFEIASLLAATVIASSALQDGESTWLEGAMFLAIYGFFAAAFWFHP